MDKQCLFHPKDKHSSRNCHGIHSLFKTSKKLDDKDGDEGVNKDKQAVGFQPADKVANVIFGGIAQDESKRKQKLNLYEILSVKPLVPTYLKWSETPISFSREDQWTSYSNLGLYLLVLDPVVVGARLTRTLIDGGSGLNILFAKTLKKMGLDITNLLKPTDSPFYGIVPGNTAVPLGQVTLPVTFGTEVNYRTEYLRFEVTDFDSSYHAIFGRPAITKFMAVPTTLVSY